MDKLEPLLFIPLGKISKFRQNTHQQLSPSMCTCTDSEKALTNKQRNKNENIQKLCLPGVSQDKNESQSHQPLFFGRFGSGLKETICVRMCIVFACLVFH